MVFKPKREKNNDLLNYIKTLPCIVCRAVPSDPDHVTTRGAGGGDTATNVWPLCREHHTERHNKGLKHMIENYASCDYWLQKAERFDVFEKVKSEPWMF